MKIGTKSVLYGAHCFLLHWFFVACGWWQLHRFRRVQIGERRGTTRHRGFLVFRDEPVYTSILDPRLWVAFFVHDIGYWGKPNMDGEEGEQHPRTGATIMHRLFDAPGSLVWNDFVFFHSRFLAKRYNARPSALCIADKLAIAIEPWWLYLPRVNLTGEVREYMAKSSAMNNTGSKYSGMNLNVSSQRAWHRDMVAYIRKWVAEHRDGREDTWTPNTKGATVTSTGVLQ